MITGIGVCICGGVLRAATGMSVAGVSNEDGALLDAVAGPAVRHALIDSVLIVQTTASRIEFKELITHSFLTSREVVASVLVSQTPVFWGWFSMEGGGGGSDGPESGGEARGCVQTKADEEKG